MKYRVDSFFDHQHISTLFESIGEARHFAAAEKRRGRIVFILEETYEGSGFFEIIGQI